jgi:hypothetical protein
VFNKKQELGPDTIEEAKKIAKNENKKTSTTPAT